MFRGHQAHMESCCFISNGEFLSGSDDGCVALWNTIRKKPVFIAHSVHGSKTEQDVAAGMDNAERPVTAAVEAWVGAVAVCRNSDLAASGAGDGNVQLWELENSNSSLRALHKLPVVSYLLNALPLGFSGDVFSLLCDFFSLQISLQLSFCPMWSLHPVECNRMFWGAFVPILSFSLFEVNLSIDLRFVPNVQEGFVNSLAFAHSGRFVLAGTGQVCNFLAVEPFVIWAVFIERKFL